MHEILSVQTLLNCVPMHTLAKGSQQCWARNVLCNLASYSNHSADHEDIVNMSMMNDREASGWIIVGELLPTNTTKERVDLHITASAKSSMITK